MVGQGHKFLKDFVVAAVLGAFVDRYIIIFVCLHSSSSSSFLVPPLVFLAPFFFLFRFICTLHFVHPSSAINFGTKVGLNDPKLLGLFY